MKRIIRSGPVYLLCLFMLMVGGCATPVGVTSAGRNYGYAQIDQSALTSSEISSYTAVVLHRYDLERLNAKSSTRCLVALHQRACADNRRDTLFALSELSFLLGKKDRRLMVNGRSLPSENFFAASAVYAYLFLLGPSGEEPLDSFDRRFRMASDFYNRSLGYVIARVEDKESANGRQWLLPVGSVMTHRGDRSDFDVQLKENETFISADRFRIRGFSVRNRNAGLGAPVVIVRPKKLGSGDGVAKCATATVFLRVQGSLADMTAGSLRAEVEIYSAFARDHIEVTGRQIPLEQDLTTPIAYALNNPLYWKMGKMLFRMGQAPFDPGIYPAQGYQPGKIPVLFVHGTMSSPVGWSEMWNTLMGDPVLREKYQFWFYLYDSAKPVGQSAVHLRESIEGLVSKWDPDGKDPMLRNMVVIGHSQGGLLTKLTATKTDETLIRAVTGKTLAELKLSPEDESLVRRMSIFEPLPEVKRVIFISTPHRGSYRAAGYVRNLARRFLALPKQALKTTTQLLTLESKMGPQVKLAATSLDTMAPDNPAMLALADIPVAPPIKAHSIIAIKGNDVPPEGADGVVKYSSAHIEGVESELVVRSGHSCQWNPVTIEEVRRILLKHLQEISATNSVAPHASP